MVPRQQNKKRLKENIHLAEQLGAKIETVCGEDVPFLLAEYARNSGISKTVTGRNAPSYGLMKKTSFTDKLALYAPEMDIYIIPDHNITKDKRKIWSDQEKTMYLKNLVSAVLCLLVSTLIGFTFFQMHFSDTNIITIYILGVMISAILTSSRLISFLQSIASVIVFNYCFTEPRFSLDTYDPGYPITFVITFLAALLTSNLALKMKKQAGSVYRKRKSSCKVGI